ncbi:MAG: RNA polymerase sigma factor [Bacteroidales bacterium]|nr:RNA polymerase sigma factor [Bacteroidales bacterium]
MSHKTGSKPTDELIRLAIIGDGAAFTELWDSYSGALRAYLRGWMKQLDDFYVDDICSRSFEKAFRQIGSYDPAKSQFQTWLHSIARHTALDIMEQEQRIRRKYVSISEAPDGMEAIERLGDEASSPLEEIIRSEDRAQNERCIEGLPELYRQIARRRFVDGLQYKEIADETGLELNTIRTRIRRAKALMDKMKEEEK